MKNRVKLVVALLASVLVFCGMFTLTSFAEDSTAVHTHNWGFKNPEHGGTTYPKDASICFFCTNKPCDYDEQHLHFIRVIAKNEIYVGDYGYPADELVSFTGDVDAFEATGDLTLSEPVYYQNGEKLGKAPKAVGKYTVEYTVLNKGVATNYTIKDDFEILSITATAKELTFGDRVSAKDFTITVGNGDKAEVVDPLKCNFYITSLDPDNKDTGYKENEFPKEAGHYEALIIVPRTDTRNGGIVEVKFEIKQARNGFSFFPLSLDPSALQNVDMTDKSFNALNVLFELVKSGVVKLPVGSGTTYVKPINYGEPVFIAAFYNGKLYNPAQMGKITIKYSGTTAAGKTVSGTFIPGITMLNAGTYKFSGKITETKNVAYDTYDFEDVIITQCVPKMISEPEAVEGLVVNGNYQKLVTAGKLLNSRHGKILYSFKKVANEGEEDAGYSSYSSLIPTARDAGKYVVKYKVIATENKNFKDSDEVKIKVSIAATKEELNPDDDEEEAVPSDTPVPAAKSVKVEGKRRAMKVSWKAIDSADLAKVSNVEIQYSKDKNFKKGLKTRRVGKSKTAATIKFLKKGTYYVRVRNVRYNNIITNDGIDTLTPVKTSSDWSKTKKVVVK